MNRKESLELFEQGENAWNTWANDLLAEKNVLKLADIWMGGDKSQWNDETRSWHKKAKADFSLHVFESDADFRNFQFPGEVSFQTAEFQRYAKFESAVFIYDANFRTVTFSKSCKFGNSTFTKLADFFEAEFKNHADFSNVMFLNDGDFDSTKFDGGAHFESAEFEGRASFQAATFFRETSFTYTKFKNWASYMDAKFWGLTVFHNSEFEGGAMFLQCSFKSGVSFGGSSFKKFAIFRAVSGKGLFSVSNVKFISLPDFTEAHFEEAPLFDDVELKPECFEKSQAHETKLNLPSHWGALKRLAIQAHDHERELQFFKGEIIARRGTEDNWTYARFWFGWLYQILSDFGRSMGRPLFWLGISLMLFAAIYACQSPADWYQPLIKPSPVQTGSSASRIVALGVSVINAFPFPAISSSDLLNQFYACLLRYSGRRTSNSICSDLCERYSIFRFSSVALFIPSGGSKSLSNQITLANRSQTTEDMRIFDSSS